MAALAEGKGPPSGTRCPCRGQGPQAGEEMRAPAEARVHHLGLCGLLSRSTPCPWPPAPLASLLPAAGGPVPAALKSRGSQPPERAPFPCPHPDPAPATQGLPTPQPFPRGPTEGQPDSPGWRGARRAVVGWRLRAEEVSGLAEPGGRRWQGQLLWGRGQGRSWAELSSEASPGGLRGLGEMGPRGTRPRCLEWGCLAAPQLMCGWKHRVQLQGACGSGAG